MPHTWRRIGIRGATVMDVGTAGGACSSGSGGAAGHQIAGPAVPIHTIMQRSAFTSGGSVRPGIDKSRPARILASFRSGGSGAMNHRSRPTSRP